MTTRSRLAPDPGPTLIRINPARIHTQVTKTVRYRPVRSLLLLVLLVIVSLFVLLTLSQMAVVQHTMMSQLDPRRPGVATLGVGNLVGGRPGARTPQKAWKSQFSQFKIEPLLIRNAPSVEVNTALADNRRRAGKLAAIIVRNSILVRYNFSATHHSTHPSPEPTHVPTHVPNDAQEVGTGTHGPTDAQEVSAGTQGPKEVGTSPQEVGTGPQEVGTGPQEVGTGPQEVGTGTQATIDVYSPQEVPNSANKSAPVGAKVTRVRGTTRAASSVPHTRRRQSHASAKAQRRLFLSRVAACDEGEAPCEVERHRAAPLLLPRGTSTSPSTSSSTLTPPDLAGTSPNATIAPSPSGDPAMEGDEAGPLPTEFSETERDFEPLYLREDEERDDLTDDDDDDDVVVTTPPPPKRRRVPPRLSEEQLRALPQCPEIPPGLQGHLNMDVDGLEERSLAEVLSDLDWVLPGGRWSPVHEPVNPCLPRHQVAVVLPYRDRLHHLVILLSWLHPILRRQQLEYTIYVAEQAGNATFNKGAIMNAGFMEAWQRGDANCFVFHDVDLLPEDDRNMYSCPPQPRHLSVGVDTLGYKLPYFLLVGGVLSVRGDHFLRLNGYSNMYWGWGGEDDDMGYRIKQSGLSITRPPTMLARYTMIKHLKRRPLTWKVRGKLVRTSGRRYRLDGLNSLKYNLVAIHRHPLFTHLLLDVGTPPENLVRLDAH